MLNSFGVNSWKPVNLGGFWQRKGDFYYGNASFSTFLLSNFYRSFESYMLIAMKNSQLSLEKKILCEVCGRFFWSFLHQCHLALW